MVKEIKMVNFELGGKLYYKMMEHGCCCKNLNRKKISNEKLFLNNLMPNFSEITSLAVVYYVAMVRIRRHYHELPS